MYAVVKTGGKQLRVEPGDVIDVELLGGSAGDKVELDQVLMVVGDETRIGRPLVEGARVVATIEGESKGPKIKIFKYRRRKRYRLRKGHRQHYTRIKIDSIEV
jgi:large subunit ribosomal protein L21